MDNIAGVHESFHRGGYDRCIPIFTGKANYRGLVFPLGNHGVGVRRPVSWKAKLSRHKPFLINNSVHGSGAEPCFEFGS